MPGGKYDSSKTRVNPVFKELSRQKSDWVRRLLELPTNGSGKPPDGSIDLRFMNGDWWPIERGLVPAVSLLSWLIRNGDSLRAQGAIDDERRSALLKGEPGSIARALHLLRTQDANRGWYIFEGLTYPDVYLETPDALIVVEGKRTEPTATTITKWLDGRHQMWRHIDAAWEIRGRRKVYGFFIVEGISGSGSQPPAQWVAASGACCEGVALRTSFPHRSDREITGIAQCFLGVTTWQKVCATFGIDFSTLPVEVSISDQRPETIEAPE